MAGGGIAGLAAAATAVRAGLRTLVMTGDVLGGHLLSIEWMDGYPGFPDGVPGCDLCPMVQEQAVAAGAETAAWHG
jgi:thioredoxin reductase (NADPH)